MGDGAVKVAIRCRPLLAEERESQLPCCVEISSGTGQVVVAAEKGFTFDYAFDTDTTQEQLYNCCVKSLIAKVMTGYNCSVLVYGQTGSGKTYTMGTDYGQQTCGGPHRGILPRVLDDLFEAISRAEVGRWTMKVSFLEIYNENAYDLLATGKVKEPLAIREIGKAVLLPGLEHVAVESSEKALECLKQGCGARSTGATVLNANSSRSHAVFTVHLQCTLQESVLTSKLQLVDLAGSETVKKTCSVGDRRKEGVNINLGLLALGKVISSLCSEGSKAPYISYRGSTLTRLLKESLNEHNYTVMIACISPAVRHVVETVNTLRFVDCARQIKIKPVINKSNKENVYRRTLEAVPPTPAFWRASAPVNLSSTSLGGSGVPLKLESTPLESTAEKHGDCSPPPNASVASCSSFYGNVDPFATLAQKDFPLTPLVERMCSRLEKTVFKGVATRLRPYGVHLNEETPFPDVTLTLEQKSVLEDLNKTITAARERLAGRKSAEERSASPLLESQNSPDPTAEESGIACRDRRRTTVLIGDRDASPVRSKRPRRSVACTSGARKTTQDAAAIGYKTRRRTTIFAVRSDTDTTPPSPIATRRPRRSVAVRPATKKPLAPLLPVSAEKAQQIHNENILRILNSGSEAQLRQLLCVGPKTAKILSLHTKLRGRLESFAALEHVPGLGASFLRRFVAANVLTA